MPQKRSCQLKDHRELEQLAQHDLTRIYVTVYGKTRHMGFLVKVEFDASMTCIKTIE